MILVTNLSLIIIFYIIGSLPFALIFTKLFGFGDIRNIGSGNVGATNVLRTGNKLIGYLTLSLDVLKAVIPVLYIKFNLPELIYLSSLSVFIGHVFPLWLKFKGGKGVATYLGIILALSFKLALIFGLAWLILLLIFRYSSLSSIISSLIVFLSSLLFMNYSLTILLFTLFVTILYTHRDNIVRLKNKSENKINL